MRTIKALVCLSVGPPLRTIGRNLGVFLSPSDLSTQSTSSSSARRWSSRHNWTGPVWLAVYVGLVVAPIVVVLVGRAPAGVDFWWNLAMALGLAGLSMMGIQFALTARIRQATAPFGADLVYVFHRYLALIGFALVGGHFLILYVGYGHALGSLDPRVAAWEMTAARVALVAFGLAVVTAEFRKILRIPYGLWRYLHVALALIGLFAAIAHVIGTGRLSQTPATLLLWMAMTAFWMGLIVWLRVVKPFGLKHRPYKVVALHEERGGAWTIALEPDGWAGMTDFSPGQFAWLNLSGSPMALEDHPFSISSSPTLLPRVEMTIKALGDFTATIPDIPIGKTAWIDGPFGAFTSDRYPDAEGLVFIAGGIGVTPIISMLRTLADREDRRPLWLFYANPDWEAVAFRDEIDALSTRLDLKVVHVIEEPPEDFAGEAGLLDRKILEANLPDQDRQGLHYFLCGPVPLTSAAEDALHDLGIPASHVRTELFELT